MARAAGPGPRFPAGLSIRDGAVLGSKRSPVPLRLLVTLELVKRRQQRPRLAVAQAQVPAAAGDGVAPAGASRAAGGSDAPGTADAPIGAADVIAALPAAIRSARRARSSRPR